MPDYDDMLQKKLSDLENGADLDEVLQDLPEEAKEIGSLIRLASTVRTMPHPEPAAQTSLAQIQQRADADSNPADGNLADGNLADRNQADNQQETSPTLPAADRTQPAAGIPPVRRSPADWTHDTIPAGRNRQPYPNANRGFWAWLSTGAFLATAGAAAVFIGLLLVGVNLWISGRQMDTARVEAMTGQVQVATNAAGTTWKNISTGYRLKRGDQLRTLGASSATLAFFEGSRTLVSPNSALALEELNGSSGKAIQVKIDLTSGETSNKVTPLQGKKSYFLVQTPSGTASVHGTEFYVRVTKNGLSKFAVNTGVVQVKNNTGEVTLQAGQTTSASENGAIADPTYQFSVQGSVLSIDETTGTWEVSGMEFDVVETTAISGQPQLGDTVSVTGRILEDQTRVANSIEPADDNNQTAFFTGTLEKNEGEEWQVSGLFVTVNQDTRVDENLAIGDPVRITFNLLNDGTWLGLKVESLVENPQEPVTTATMTADPNARPSYEFTPDEVGNVSCESSDLNVTGTLRNTASDAKDYAANVRLGYLIDRGGQYIDEVSLSPDEWTRIDAGQTVTFQIHMRMNEKWSEAQKNQKPDDDENDAEVKLRIFIASATNRPDHLNGRLTVTVRANCQVDQTPTITGTFTATQPTESTLEGTNTPRASKTPTAPSPTRTPAKTGQCPGDKTHPTGMKLAQRYGVPYTEIMKWFCQHYGFGEIDLAYSLSRQSGKPVQEIFAMKASGMGWGNIKKAVLGDKKPGSGNSGKNNGKKDKNKNK